VTQDKSEIAQLGHGRDPDTNGDGANDRTASQIASVVCTGCHSVQGGPSGDFLNLVNCGNVTWKQHLVQGRLAPKVWEFITTSQTGSTCAGVNASRRPPGPGVISPTDGGAFPPFLRIGFQFGVTARWVGSVAQVVVGSGQRRTQRIKTALLLSLT
jgi:hypothetical protein